MRHTVQMVEQAPVNNALLNVVTPMGLSFEKNRLSIGGEHRKGLWYHPVPTESGCGVAFKADEHSKHLSIYWLQAGG